MSKKRIDLTLYEGHTKGDPNDNPDSWRVVGDGFVMNGTSPQPRYIGYIRHSNFEPDIPAKQEPLSLADANLIADGPLLVEELKRCYRIIDILQDGEDFDTQVAFHEEGLCEYLKYPCGPCESSEEE